MTRLGKPGRGRVYLALAYLIWSLLPHFHVLFHSHAGGAHFHASLAAPDLALANRVLDNLDASGLSATDGAEVGGEASAARHPGALPAALPGDRQWVTDRADANRHAHFWEDPNAAGAASGPVSIPFLAACVALSAAIYAAPHLRALRRPSARGPPAFLPA